MEPCEVCDKVGPEARVCPERPGTRTCDRCPGTIPDSEAGEGYRDDEHESGRRTTGTLGDRIAGD